MVVEITMKVEIERVFPQGPDRDNQIKSNPSVRHLSSTL